MTNNLTVLLLASWAGALFQIGYLLRHMAIDAGFGGAGPGVISDSPAAAIAHSSFSLDDGNYGSTGGDDKDKGSLRATAVGGAEEASVEETSDQDSQEERLTGAFADCAGHTTKEATSGNHHDQNQVTISCHTFPYRMPAIAATAKKEIVVGVLSNAGGDGPERRQAIRDTWATLNPKAKVYFIVAGPWENIQDEYEMYGDLLWLDLDEVYEGEDSVLPYKTLAFLKVVHDSQNQHVKYAFKTDDDSFVNIDLLQEYLEDKETPPDYWGSCQPSHWPPKRDASAKWKISEELYPEEWYPPYCQGAGFAVSRTFLDCAAGSPDNIAKLRWIPFEDVAVGLLAERCSIEPVRASSRRMRMLRTEGHRGEHEERYRVQNGKSKIHWRKLPRPDFEENEGLILQHRIYDGNDMRDHWKALRSSRGRS